MILTDAEIHALDGLTAFDFKLYCLLRWKMDYRTGIVGRRRRYSWQALSEWMYVEPAQGRHESGAPSKMKLRRAAQRLVDAGLLEPIGPVVFRCILAQQDNSARNMSDRRATHERHPLSDTVESSDSLGKTADYERYSQMSDRRATHERHPMSDTPPVSGSNNYSVAQHGSNSPRARVDPALVAALAKTGFTHQQVHTPKVMGMLRDWSERGVTEEQLTDLVALVRNRSPGRAFTPAYLEKPMNDYLEQQHDEASRENGQAGTGAGRTARTAAERASEFWRITGEYAARSLDSSDIP